jgi:hypothetical protein
MSTAATRTTSALTRRTAFAGLGAGGLGLAFGVGTSSARAQDVAIQAHPLVGTWFLDNGTANLTDALDSFILHADGTYIEANADGTVRLGVWEATGPTTATLTIEAYSRDETGANLGAIIIRLLIELNPDGNSYTAEGTIELIAPDGSSSGQAGPATGTATRMMVEAPGAPVMTLDELFGGSAGTAEVTPGAGTPAS